LLLLEDQGLDLGERLLINCLGGFQPQLALQLGVESLNLGLITRANLGLNE
jgi:hypothetical protein